MYQCGHSVQHHGVRLSERRSPAVRYDETLAGATQEILSDHHLGKLLRLIIRQIPTGERGEAFDPSDGQRLRTATLFEKSGIQVPGLEKRCDLPECSQSRGDRHAVGGALQLALCAFKGFLCLLRGKALAVGKLHDHTKQLLKHLAGVRGVRSQEHLGGRGQGF